MESNRLSTFIIYHEVKPSIPCPDGIMAAAIAALAHPDATLIGDSYKNEADYGDRPFVAGLPILEMGDRLIIVDFSYPAAWLHYWESLGIEITLIDHHAPKFPMLSGFAGAILDADECGATLTWRHFFPEEPQPEILRHVRRRDIGADGYYKSAENCRDSKAITAAMSYVRSGHKDPIKACQEWLEPDFDDEQLLLFGLDLLKEEEAIALAIACTANESELCGHTCGKVQTTKDTDRLTSQIGNAIALAHPEWEFAWIVASDGVGNSLRSANGFDVAAIASQMGGGGHRAAAGWSAKNRPSFFEGRSRSG
jgi:hypothetical protein